MNREQHLERLRQDPFDLLVVGGGATGAGTALDAATRGLKVALVERDDFSSGTSSRSTKLIHGGVRYLELAVKHFDRGQLHLVREALQERGILLKNAPHLSRPLAILTPLYKRHEIAYYRFGLKLYDWLAGARSNLQPSRKAKKEEIVAHFPLLKNDRLKGGVLYFDGQFDDARMNIALVKTAAEQGAAVANYLEVKELLKDQGRVVGARVLDGLAGQGGAPAFPIRAKVVVNATGPMGDSLRQMDDPQTAPMLTASSGVHLILDKKFCSSEMGLLFPKTDDGRVLFMLPWLGHTLIGTTDIPAAVTVHPKPTEGEVEYLINHIQKYIQIPLKKEDILSAWSGLRPLVSNPDESNTARLSRDHYLQVSRSGLVTISGGKWTTYRRMAFDAVEQAIAVGQLQVLHPSGTATLPLIGGANYSPDLVQEVQKKMNLDWEVSSHLTRAYGDRVNQVLDLASKGYGARLNPVHPYLEAEVLYAIQEEMAQTAVDFLARRTRLAFLDRQATLQAAPRVIDLMADQLHWSAERREQERLHLLDYLSF